MNVILTNFFFFFFFFCTKQPPPSFLATMEEYIKEAPQTGSVNKRLVRKCVHMTRAFWHTYMHESMCMLFSMQTCICAAIYVYVYVYVYTLVYYPTAEKQQYEACLKKFAQWKPSLPSKRRYNVLSQAMFLVRLKKMLFFNNFYTFKHQHNKYGPFGFISVKVIYTSILYERSPF